MEKRFSVGDTLTFKSRRECGGSYCYGGDCQGGETGIVICYFGDAPNEFGYKLKLKLKNSYGYVMRESEFREYDVAVSSLPSSTKKKPQLKFRY